MAERICESFRTAARRLMELGLGYLTLDRAAATLSTGERQRMQLARAVRNRTTGVLYVLDEPSIGLHPGQHGGADGGDGRPGGGRELRAAGGSRYPDPVPRGLDHRDGAGGRGSGRPGGGPRAPWRSWPPMWTPGSGPSCQDRPSPSPGPRPRAGAVFAEGAIHLETGAIHTVKPLALDLPKGKLTVVTGVSGSGKTTLILESLVPGLEAMTAGKPLPAHVKAVEAPGIGGVNVIDATPIASISAPPWPPTPTSTTSCGSSTPEARRPRPWGTRRGTSPTTRESSAARCVTAPAPSAWTCSSCPNVDIPCPACRGSRYGKDAALVRLKTRSGAEFTLPELMDMDIHMALERLRRLEGGSPAAPGAGGAGSGLSDPGGGHPPASPRGRPSG